MRTWHTFVDESGDHSLDRVDPDFPVFVLAAVLVEREAYLDAVIPALARLKVEHWGHEGVVFHSSDIRRRSGPFALLQVPAVRDRFLCQLEDLISALPFGLHLSVLDKRGLACSAPMPGNAYSLALTSCMMQIEAAGVIGPDDVLQVVAESRGAHEDAQLRDAFMSLPLDSSANRIRSGGGLRFAAKRLNVAGLQLADLCARPIGRWVIDPLKPNRPAALLRAKMRRDGGSLRHLGQ